MNRVAVILSSYNGEKYITQQIESVLNQKEVDLTLFIRDDGSTDSTPQILRKYSGNRCIVFLEKNIGVTSSFMTMLSRVNGYDYYAFCDQDDVWSKYKIINAINSIKKSSKVPAMYYSRVTAVDKNLVKIPQKSNFDNNHSFSIHEIFLRNNAIGCTMVINDALKTIVTKKMPNRITMHDHWIYCVCRSINGVVIYDEKSFIKYRQHDSNVVGNKKGIVRRIKHSCLSHKNRGIRSEMARFLYKSFYNLIPSHNKQIVYDFGFYKKSLSSKIQLIKKEMKYAYGLKNRVLFSLEVLFGLF